MNHSEKAALLNRAQSIAIRKFRKENRLHLPQPTKNGNDSTSDSESDSSQEEDQVPGSCFYYWQQAKRCIETVGFREIDFTVQGTSFLPRFVEIHKSICFMVGCETSDSFCLDMSELLKHN